MKHFSVVALVLFYACILVTGCKSSEGCTDITNAYLTRTSFHSPDYVGDYCATVKDLHSGTSYQSYLKITTTGGQVNFATNNIPNHDFNSLANPFANTVGAQTFLFRVPATPILAATPTPTNLSFYNGVMLNGVVLDQVSDGCCGVGDEIVGCNTFPYDWRKDPVSPLAGFKADAHNAHANGDDIYHYHGDPHALYDPAGTAISPVIGFAADGFPIYGPFIRDSVTGAIRKAHSSYHLKMGKRPPMSCPVNNHHDSTYNGTYEDDYVYASGSGDLDECNGMWVSGHYGYYVSDDFPHVVKCLRGVIDSTFYK